MTIWRAAVLGMGRLVDLFGVMPPVPPKSDAEALRSDWDAVGRDMAGQLSPEDNAWALGLIARYRKHKAERGEHCP